jgi:hypothetical protein
VKRDNSLVLALVIQATLNAAAGSAYLAQIAPVWVVALVGLFNSMTLAGTAAYVGATKGSDERRVTSAAVEAAVEAVTPPVQPPPANRRRPF